MLRIRDKHARSLAITILQQPKSLSGSLWFGVTSSLFPLSGFGGTFVDILHGVLPEVIGSIW